MKERIIANVKNRLGILELAAKGKGTPKFDAVIRSAKDFMSKNFSSDDIKKVLIEGGLVTVKTTLDSMDVRRLTILKKDAQKVKLQLMSIGSKAKGFEFYFASRFIS